MVKPYIASKLISWQKKAGRHNLPWQKTNDAYQIWISEVMLQQTRVEVVIAYFERWMGKFPTIQSVANAPLQDILKAESKSDKIPFEYTLGNCSFDEDQAKFQLIVTFKGNSVEPGFPKM